MTISELSQIKAVAADADGTLLEGRVKPEMVSVLHQLMQRFPFAIVSGSSYQALERKIVHDLLPSQTPFDVYASGGSVRLTYQAGPPVYDTQHAQDVAIPKQDIDSVRSLVESMAQVVFNWAETVWEANKVANLFRDWARGQQEGYVWSHPSKWRIKVTQPGEIDSHSAIRVEKRQDPLGRRAVGLSVKSIPRMIEGQPTRFVNRLSQALRHQMPNYQILPAGFASIDVNLGNGNKARAISHMAKDLNISTQEILYLGDEFSEHGNDGSVMETGAKCIDVSTGGPDQTIRHLRDLLLAE